MCVLYERCCEKINGNNSIVRFTAKNVPKITKNEAVGKSRLIIIICKALFKKNLMFVM